MTTTEKKRYLFAKLPPILQDFGFFLFKGKLWCYRPERQVVYCIDCTFTQWGTLNEVEVSAGTFCAPVLKGMIKNTFSFGTVICLCRYIRLRKDFTVYAMYGENADNIFTAQVDALQPYLKETLERMFDTKYQTAVLDQMRLMLDMQREMTDQVSFDFALYQYQRGNVQVAREFLQRRIISCEQAIEYVHSERERIGNEHLEFLCNHYGSLIDEVNEYARRMDNRDPQLSKMIDERIKESAALCEEFFRHRRKKATP